MEDAQREIYEARVQKLLDSLSKQRGGVRVGKLQILAELTHLRQLCFVIRRWCMRTITAGRPRWTPVWSW